MVSKNRIRIPFEQKRKNQKGYAFLESIAYFDLPYILETSQASDEL